MSFLSAAQCHPPRWEKGLSRLLTADGRGWLSEQLNPLSGHRGPIVSLLPLPVVLRYRVVIRDGALVRQTCELASPQVSPPPSTKELSVAGTSNPLEHWEEINRSPPRWCAGPVGARRRVTAGVGQVLQQPPCHALHPAPPAQRRHRVNEKSAHVH